MMDKEFDFDGMGKVMPYRVPPTFFASSEENILARIRAEERAPKKSRLIRFVIPALAVAAMLMVVLSISVFRQADSPEETAVPGIFASASLQLEMLAIDPDTPDEMDIVIQNLSDDELAELVAQVNGDVFLF